MANYFHYSPLRTPELKKVASDHGLKVLHIPKNLEIRWSQFTFTPLQYFVFMESISTLFSTKRKIQLFDKVGKY